MDFSNENKCILELSKPQGFDKSFITQAFNKPLNLPYILGQLLFNRVGGIAYTVISECDLLAKINREFRNPLKMIYDSSKARTESFLQSEALLSEIFANADFPCAFLKGALLSQIYSVGCRTSNDFDVLINQQDTQKITNLLLQNGFAQGFLRNDIFTPATRSDIIYARMNKGETVPFVKQIDLPYMKWLEIDVNFSLDFKASQDNDAVEQILMRTQNSIKTASGTLPTLSPIDFLIHLCGHLYKEATTLHWVRIGRDLSLYKFCDIYLFVNMYMEENFADALTKSIIELELQTPCYYTFYYTRELFGINNPVFDKVIEQIKPQDSDIIRNVFDPVEKKVYRFDMDYTDYFFHSNRLSCLKEI